MAEQPRIVIVDASGGPAATDLLGRDGAIVADLAEAFRQAQSDDVAGVVVETRQPAVRAQADKLQRAGQILDTLPDGVAVLDADLNVLWSNPAFERWDGGGQLGRPLQETLHCFEALTPESGPFVEAKAGGVGATRLPCDRNRFVELRVALAHDGPRFVVQLRDVSRAEMRQQKLDALHHAGRALNNLAADELAATDIGERVELLKDNIRHFVQDMLHYDVIEVRLLNRTTGLLEPLLQEGMTSEASQRPLHPLPQGNGVTGFVAATGQSYLCNDTTSDPLYIEGFVGAKSSLTVPLKLGEEVIGTFNVESPRANAFGEEDRQFAEMFGREVAQAVHTLDLLTAEKRCAGSESVEAISREVAMPVNDILTAAAALLAGTNGHDPETAAKLKQIYASARAIKASIVRAGLPYAPPPPPEGSLKAKLQGLRVLVLEGDDRSRRAAHAQMAKLGCDVDTAATAQDALAMAHAESGDYDAILLDIRPPGLSGYEAYRQLRDSRPDARMIMMTAFGYDESHSIVKAKADGLRLVVFKPFLTEQLTQSLAGPIPPLPGEARP